MEDTLEHEKRARVREVEALQAQLRQREVELQDAKLNLDRETDARRIAEAQVADIASKGTEQAQQIKELEAEVEGLYDDVQQLGEKYDQQRSVNESLAAKTESLKWVEQQVRFLRHKEKNKILK